MRLAEYDGRPVDAIKVGTFVRSKGLEFKYVFLPRYQQSDRNPIPRWSGRVSGRAVVASCVAFAVLAASSSWWLARRAPAGSRRVAI